MQLHRPPRLLPLLQMPQLAWAPFPLLLFNGKKHHRLQRRCMVSSLWRPERPCTEVQWAEGALRRLQDSSLAALLLQAPPLAVAMLPAQWHWCPLVVALQAVAVVLFLPVPLFFPVTSRALLLTANWLGG
jgi:hypothetical protein